MRRTTIGNIHEIAKEAIASRYRDLPPLPHWQVLAGWLRKLHQELNEDSGGQDVCLSCLDARYPDQRWSIAGEPGEWPGAPHTEYVSVPGEGKPFDATAAARRLLSEARLAGFR